MSELRAMLNELRSLQKTCSGRLGFKQNITGGTITASCSKCGYVVDSSQEEYAALAEAGKNGKGCPRPLIDAENAAAQIEILGKLVEVLVEGFD
jgi:hypothetical protein